MISDPPCDQMWRKRRAASGKRTIHSHAQLGGVAFLRPAAGPDLCIISAAKTDYWSCAGTAALDSGDVHIDAFNQWIL